MLPQVGSMLNGIRICAGAGHWGDISEKTFQGSIRHTSSQDRSIVNKPSVNNRPLYDGVQAFPAVYEIYRKVMMNC